MPIDFACVCGFEVQTLDGQVGRKVICPMCRSDLTVPPRSTLRHPEAAPNLGIVLESAPLHARRRAPILIPSLAVLVVLAVAPIAYVVVSPQSPATLTQSAKVSEILARKAGAADAFELSRLAGIREAREKQAREAREVEAREARLRAASEVAGLEYPIVRSKELDRGKRFAFLCLRKDGQFFSKIVEAGTMQLSYGEDRYFWETATDSELATMWAGRDHDGEWRVASVERGPWSLRAIVVNQATGGRWDLRMDGWWQDGRPKLSMTLIRE
jgi:hypothetical protein